LTLVTGHHEWHPAYQKTIQQWFFYGDPRVPSLPTVTKANTEISFTVSNKTMVHLSNKLIIETVPLLVIERPAHRISYVS